MLKEQQVGPPTVEGRRKCGGTMVKAIRLLGASVLRPDENARDGMTADIRAETLPSKLAG